MRIFFSTRKLHIFFGSSETTLLGGVRKVEISSQKRLVGGKYFGDGILVGNDEFYNFEYRRVEKFPLVIPSSHFHTLKINTS